MTSFKSAVLRKFGAPLGIERVSIGGLAAQDVIVRIKATSLCHTDVEAVEGLLDSPLPLIPGHEAAGVVEWIGKSVQNVQVGDHVIISWNPHCNSCFYCERQQPILCDEYRDNARSSFHFDGAPRLFIADDPVHQLMYAGTFAEAVVVTESCAVKVSKAIPFHLACLIGCGVMTGVGAVLNIAKVEPGSSVSVLGCGAVGLSAIQGAKLARAKTIVAIDTSSSKLELAFKLGATHGLLAGPALQEEHSKITSGRGADYLFEAAGNTIAFQSSLDLVRPGGQVVWLGKLPQDNDLVLRWGSLMGEKRIIRSSYGGSKPKKDFPLLVDAYLNEKLKLDEYVTSRIPLEEINVAIDRLKAGLEIRAVVEL